MTRSVFDHFGAQARTYARRSAGWLWGPLRAREARAVLALLDPRPGERILDAGCGAGFYAKRIAACGAAVTGVDGSPAMVEAARAEGVDAQVHDLQTAPPPGGPHDKILCAGVLEFCEDPRGVVRNLHAALKPAGQLVLLVPAASLGGRLYRLHHRRHGLEVRLFRRGEIAALLPEGLEIRAARRVAFSLIIAAQDRPTR